MTCPAMQVAKGALEHNLPNAHVMEQMKDYCLRTRIASVRFGTLLDDPVLFPAIHDEVPKCLVLQATDTQCRFVNRCNDDLIIRHRCKFEATSLSTPVDAHGLESDESLILQQGTFGCSREHKPDNEWYVYEDCAELMIGVTRYSALEKERIERAWAKQPSFYECETFLELVKKYGVSEKART